MPDEIADNGGCNDTGNETEDRFEGRLILVSGADGCDLHEEEGQGGENRHDESEDDNSLRPSKTVDLGEHIAEDVGEGEEDRAPVEDEVNRPGIQRRHLRCSNVRNEEESDEHDGDDVEDAGCALWVGAGGVDHEEPCLS